MKKLVAAFFIALSLGGIAHSAYFQAQTYLPVSAGPVNMGGGANMLERSLFSTNTPNLAYSAWNTPGNGSPAVSTSDYLGMAGIMRTRPYDLDTMGSDGATIKAANGGKRYVWLMWDDHIGNWPGSTALFVGYSNDPQVWPEPTTMRAIYDVQNSISVVDQNGYTQTSFFAYWYPYLVYNPDSAGDKFYIYAEGFSTASARQHELTLITTPDFQSATLVGPTIPTTAFGGWTSIGNPTRLGVNSWEVYTLGKADGSTTNQVWYRYTSTDGWVWIPNFSTITTGPGPYFTISGQKYMLTREDAAGASYVALLAVNSSNVSLGTYTRISAAFGDNTSDATKAYPGPTYLQDVWGYEEDGVASIYVARGFPVSFHDATMAGPYLDNHPSFYNIQGSVTSNVLTVTSWPGSVPPIAAGFRIAGYSNKLGVTAQLTGTGGAACPDPTCTGGVGTYSMAAGGNISAGTQTVYTNGGLWQQFIDQYYLITDATAAASAAPLGVKASCAAGVATVQWNNSLPHQNYRVYKGSSAGTQATLVGNVTGTSTTDTPTANAQTWYKVVTMNGTEQKSRVVDVYCSSNTAIVNKHYLRVLNDGGTGVDLTFLASADAWLTSNNTYRYLNWWADVRFGYKLDGSGFIAKIYDLGTTLLPRGGDYTPTTSNTYPSTSSNTSYSATSFRGTTPSWINNATTARGYFGGGRANNIQRWSEITLMAAYQKPGTAIATLFGMDEFKGLYLQHGSGSSGNVTFGMVCDKVGAPTTFTTATAPFTTATAAHVAAAVFDNSNMTTYLDGVAGSPASCSASINDAMLTVNTTLRGQFALDTTSTSTGPVLVSGSQSSRFTYSTRAYFLGNSEAQFTGAGLAVFSKGLPAAQVQSWGTTFYN